MVATKHIRKRRTGTDSPIIAATLSMPTPSAIPADLLFTTELRDRHSVKIIDVVF
jgi:hypothetical protein